MYLYHNRRLLNVVPGPIRFSFRYVVFFFINICCTEKRAAEAKRILTKYPDRIPVIVGKSARSSLPEIDKKKFLVPGSMLCGEFKYIIHKHLQSQLAGGAEALSAEQTLYLFVKNTPPRTGMFLYP
jgi:GABA(A) receptor-associated protein